MAVFAIILCVFLVFVILYFYKCSQERDKNFPPGPPRLPIWGSYWYLLKENYYFLNKSVEILAKRYNTDILGLYLGKYPTIVTFNYEMCKEVLTREEFSGRNDTLLTRGRSDGELLGIFFIDDLYWKEQRRFSLRHLRDYGFGRRFSVTEEYFEKEMKDLIDMIMSDPKPKDQDICRKKGQILIPDIFYAPVLNSVLYMLVAKRFDNKELREISRSILKLVTSGDGTGGAVSITPWLRHIAPDFFGYTPVIEINQILMKFFKEQILEHKTNYSDDYHADFTDVFLSKMKELEKKNEANSMFTEEQLLWVLIDYMFPAPVTIGHILNYIFAYLLNYPDLQVKIQEEIDRVVGRSRLPNLDDRKDMPYTEAVIRETIRKEPLNPLGIPRRCKEDTTLGGYSIPKDAFVLIGIASAHHDPKVWKDPHTFKPERFLDDHGDLLKKDLTIGFGAGKRLCAGETFARQTIFLILSGLLQNFTFKPIGKAPDINKKIWGLMLGIAPIWMEAVNR